MPPGESFQKPPRSRGILYALDHPGQKRAARPLPSWALKSNSWAPPPGPGCPPRLATMPRLGLYSGAIGLPRRSNGVSATLTWSAPSRCPTRPRSRCPSAERLWRGGCLRWPWLATGFAFPARLVRMPALARRAGGIGLSWRLSGQRGMWAWSPRSWGIL